MCFLFSPFSGYRPERGDMNNTIDRKETMGRRIRALRLGKEWTQDGLAEIMCVPKSTISAYENGKVDIKSSTIVELAGIFDTTPNYILGFGSVVDDVTSEIIEAVGKMTDARIKGLLLAQI